MNNDYNNQQSEQTDQTSQPVNGGQEYPENNSQQYTYYQNEPTGYGQPTYNPPPQYPQPGKGLATASMVCGIFSLVLFYTGLFSFVGIILGIAAIITAICAKKKGFVGGMATAGLVMGIIGAVLSLVFFISCIACVGVFSRLEMQSAIEEWADEIRYYDYEWHN